MSNNVTLGVSGKTTDDDNDLYSNSYNLKVNNKIMPECYTVYAYMYGGKYVL